MRWSLRRGNRGAGAHDRTVPPAPASGAPTADPGWRAVAPLASTWGGPPLTTGPLTPRPPLTQESPRRAAVRAGDRGRHESPDPGRVTGLAAVVRSSPIAPVVPA